MASFPTRNQQPTPGFPASYQKYQPQTDCRHNLLDVQYFYLNDFIFHNTTNSSVSVNLFQAGRKKNYGYIDNQFTTLYLPAKPDDLSNWLELFNRGASIKPAGVEEEGWNHYSWQSIVVLPRSKMTQQRQHWFLAWRSYYFPSDVILLQFLQPCASSLILHSTSSSSSSSFCKSSFR